MCAAFSAHAVDDVMARTPVGTIEVRTIPALNAIMAKTDAPYFSKDNELFRTLFRYIRAQEIPMTAPVRCEMQPGRMFFYLPPGRSITTLPVTEGVTVTQIAARTVVSLGVRGGYSEDNFREGVAKLEKWLEAHPSYEATGPAYALYWNGPYIPWFLKKSDVQIPVRPVGAGASPDEPEDEKQAPATENGRGEHEGGGK